MSLATTLRARLAPANSVNVIRTYRLSYTRGMGIAADLGQDLIRTRRALGMTQRELGERIGVKQPQIARWESNAYRTASLERVDAIARALGCVADAVAGGAGLAAEASAKYGRAGTATQPLTTTVAPGTLPTPATAVLPVRDLAEIVARLRKHGPELYERFTVRRIGVFGSFLSGEQTADSDVDLLVELDELTWHGFMEAARFCEEILGRKVDFIRPDVLRERLRERVLREVLDVWAA